MQPPCQNALSLRNDPSRFWWQMHLFGREEDGCPYRPLAEPLCWSVQGRLYLIAAWHLSQMLDGTRMAQCVGCAAVGPANERYFGRKGGVGFNPTTMMFCRNCKQGGTYTNDYNCCIGQAGLGWWAQSITEQKQRGWIVTCNLPKLRKVLAIVRNGQQV